MPKISLISFPNLPLFFLIPTQLLLARNSLSQRKPPLLLILLMNPTYQPQPTAPSPPPPSSASSPPSSATGRTNHPTLTPTFTPPGAFSPPWLSPICSGGPLTLSTQPYPAPGLPEGAHWAGWPDQAACPLFIK